MVHAKGYGLADLDARQPITPSTLFDLASDTKQFTAMAVMMLVERGELAPVRVGRVLRFEVEEIRRYLDQNREALP